LPRPKRLPAQAEGRKTSLAGRQSTAVLRRGELRTDEFVVVRSFDRSLPSGVMTSGRESL